ncbi:MAG: hypothetical protein JSS89_01225 [Bacteroidetes bacterium]|nr:hypothetical protein [Bacteroidota bacterium]
MNISILAFAIVILSTMANAQSVYRWRDPSAAPITTPIVISAHGMDSAHPTIVGLNEALIVDVANLSTFLKTVNSTDEIVLVMDGQRFDGIKAESVDTNSSCITFRLTLDDFSGINQKQWAEVLGRPNPWKLKPVSISIAKIGSGYPLSTVVSKVDRIDDHGVIRAASRANGYSMQIKVIHLDRFYIASAVVIFFIVFFVNRALNTTMLRGTSESDSGKEGAYSLSLTQMAFWFMLVVISSIYLYTITTLYVPISTSVLGIITISTASALAAAGIELTKRSTAAKNNTTVEQRPTHSILTDITNDGSGGLSLQRLQVVVWTVLFGFYYCYRVWATVSIPDIDNSMLILMGLTSAAYVGGKVPEKT